MIYNNYKSLFILCFIFPVRWASPIPEVKQEPEVILQMKAEKILSYLNTSVEPCDNFYQFACGNFGKHFESQLEKTTKWHNLENIYHMTDERILQALATIDDTDLEADRKVKAFCRSAVNQTAWIDGYSAKLRQLVDEFGKMPLLEGDNWQEENFDWVQVVGEITAKTNMGIIIHPKMSPDFKNNSINRPSLLQPYLSFWNYKIYLDNSFEDMRRQHKESQVNQLVSLFGVNKIRAQLCVEEMMNFEIALAHGMQHRDTEVPNQVFAIVTMDELQEQTMPVLDAKKLFHIALDIEPDQVMVQPKYLKTLVETLERTPKRVVANYIFFTYLIEYIQHSTNDTDCLSPARYYFKEYSENLMYRKFYTGQEKLYINSLWEEIKLEFENVIESLEWIESDTRKFAAEKLIAMRLEFATYENFDYEKRFSKLNLNDYDFLGNIYEILKLNGIEARANVREAPKYRTPPESTSVYASELNVVYFPMAFLRPFVLWSHLYPRAYNMGGMGFILAHEMIHGFDDFNRNFDSHGNFKNWWDNDSAQEFKERTKCFIEQYKNYTYKGIALPETTEQTENIADNGAIRLAYKAYIQWYAKTTPTKRATEFFPNIPYQSEQLFFISYAQAFCAATSEKYIYDRGVHVPDELRIVGSLSNFPEFSKAFNCPLGSAMNPEAKCRIY